MAAQRSDGMRVFISIVLVLRDLTRSLDWLGQIEGERERVGERERFLGLRDG